MPKRDAEPNSTTSPPPPRRRSGSNSRPKPCASISLRDWVSQANPDQLLELQRLTESRSSGGGGALVCRTLAEVAEWFGLELQTVKQWRSSGCPGDEGHYEIQAIARWRVARTQNQAQPKTEGAKARLEQEQMQLQNARLQVRLARESGELVSRVAAKAAIRQMFARLAGQLGQLPDALAALVNQVDRVDFRRDATERVRNFLQQLANWEFERDVEGIDPAERVENPSCTPPTEAAGG